jgi:hypothetical protein
VGTAHYWALRINGYRAATGVDYHTTQRNTSEERNVINVTAET